MQNYLQSFPQECDEILAEGRAVCAINNIFEHTHLWEAFLTQIEEGKEACVVVMTVTDEGDPILYYIHFIHSCFEKKECRQILSTHFQYGYKERGFRPDRRILQYAVW